MAEESLMTYYMSQFQPGIPEMQYYWRQDVGLRIDIETIQVMSL